MSCEIDQSQLTAYVDQQLAEDDWQRVHIHVESCAHCRQMAMELQRTTDELEQYFQGASAPFGFEEEVMESLSSIRQTRNMNHLSAIFLICAGVGLSAVIAFLVSPLGAILGVILRTLGILVHGISLLPISLGYGWFVVFALSSVGIAAISFWGLRRLLRTLNSEVIV